MATQESLDRVQQLYVAYYGRPADQEGQEYWADRLDAEGEGAIINAFGNSEEYAAKAEGQGNATLINAIYQQAFNREADPEGLTYYAGVLERGEKTLAEIATTIINAAGGQDRLVLNARVEAAAAYTAEFGAADAYDVDAAKAAVEAAKAGVNASALTEALETLATAQEAKAEFLAGLELDTNFDGEVDVEAGDAVDGDVTDALDNARIAVNTATDAAVGDISADRSDAFNQAIIDEQNSVNEEALTDAQDAVDAVDGLQSAINRLESTQTAYAAAFEADAEAAIELTGELAKANTVNDTANWSNSLTGDLQVVDLNTVANQGDAVVTDSATPVVNVIVLGANGKLEAAENLDTSGIAGFDALLADAQAAYDADQALVSATTSFEAAIEAVIEADGGSVGTVTDYYDATSTDTAGDLTTDFNDQADLTAALLAAQETVETFNQAVDNYTSAKENADQLESLQKDVTDAQDAITDSEDDGGLGVALLTEGNGVEAADGTVDFTGDDEVYLYDAADADDDAAVDAVDITVSGFAQAGEDRIFFGEEFTLTEIPEGDDITDNVGDSSVLEILWSEDNAGLTLYVESEAFAGSSTGNSSDITEVFLAGVSAADIEFSGGYLTAGEPA